MRSDLSLQESLLRRTLPVVINSFNQYTYLRNLIEKLRADGFTNFVVCDNASTYPPLTKYYEELVTGGLAQLIPYGDNKGPHFFHMKGVYKLFGSLPHLYSDPDLTYDELSPNFLTELMVVSEKYSMFKVGPALEIPSKNELDNSVYSLQNGRRVGVAEWESQFWKEQVEPGYYYPGHLDTTFHLFNPRYFKVGSDLIDGIRIGKDGFIFKHLPWYIDKRMPRIEIDFYKNAASSKNSWKAG